MGHLEREEEEEERRKDQKARLNQQKLRHYVTHQSQNYRTKICKFSVLKLYKMRYSRSTFL